jgi:hypothetical protein
MSVYLRLVAGNTKSNVPTTITLQGPQDDEVSALCVNPACVHKNQLAVLWMLYKQMVDLQGLHLRSLKGILTD